MRLAVLTLLCSFLTFVLAANLQDKSDIEDLTAYFGLLIDDKKFSELEKVLSPDVTYNMGEGPVQGLPAAIDALSKVIPPETTTYFTQGTQLITFLPPIDKDKRSNRAKSISYSTLVSFSSGNLTGESFILFAKFVDKEIVRTKQPRFGGWRFKNRRFEVDVSFLYFNACATYHRTPPVLLYPPFVAPKSKKQSVDPSNLQGRSIGNRAVLGLSTP